jgi:hypothetical protein
MAQFPSQVPFSRSLTPPGCRTYDLRRSASQAECRGSESHQALHSPSPAQGHSWPPRRRSAPDVPRRPAEPIVQGTASKCAVRALDRTNCDPKLSNGALVVRSGKGERGGGERAPTVGRPMPTCGRTDGILRVRREALFETLERFGLAERHVGRRPRVRPGPPACSAARPGVECPGAKA